MGATGCRCHCEDTKSAPGARVLPPPGEDFNALSVTIESASFQSALLKRDKKDLELYCICQVAGKPHKKCRTSSVSGTFSPIWRYEGQLVGVDRGDGLLFQVFDRDELLASASLPSLDLLDSGFEGQLRLRLESAAGQGAELSAGGIDQEHKLFISVQPEYVPPDQAGVVQVMAVPGDSGATVCVTFQIPGSGDVNLDFTKVPLGMTFAADVMPMMVRYHPSFGQAKDLGVRQGWVITHIDGIDIQEMQYETAFGLFRERVKVLPKS